MKRAFRILGIAAIGLCLVALALPFLFHADSFRPMLESQLSAAMGRAVRLGHLRLALLSGGMSADDLSISEDPAFGRAPFLRARSLSIGLELRPLIFSRQVRVTSLAIEQPEINLLEKADGKWNFSTLGGKAAPKETAAKESGGKGIDLSAKLVKISSGRFSLTRMPSGSKPQVLEKVQLELHDFSTASAFPFSLSAGLQGGGNIRLEGKTGPLDQTGDALPPFDARLAVNRLDLVASGFVNASSGMRGVISLDGNISGKGRTIEVNGKLKAERLKLARNGTPAPKPVEFTCALSHDLARRSGVLRRGDIRIGHAAASLTGTYQIQGSSAVLDLKLHGPNMPLEELTAMLPALDIALPAGASIQGGAATAQLTMEGPLDKLVSSGNVTIEKTRLAGFDLGTKMAAIERLAGFKGGPNTDFDLVRADLKSAPDGTALDNITVVAPAIGELTGAGTVSATKALDFRMRAKLHTSGSLMAALGQKGDTTVPFLIQGTAQNPSFRPDTKAIVSEKVDKLTGGDPAKAATTLIQGLFGKKKQQ